jgi:hypothetical protein
MNNNNLKRCKTCGKINNTKSLFFCCEACRKILYYKENREKISARNICDKEVVSSRNKKYYEINRSLILNKKHLYHEQNKEKRSNYCKKWYAEHGKEYYKDKNENDINFKISRAMRSRLWLLLKGYEHSNVALKYLGCSIDELKIYLESKWQPTMSWDNWTTNGWHIDHIKPLAKFDLTDSEQLKKACHYSNLQPLWAHDNLSKGTKHER